MANPNSRDTLIDYCKRRLGEPVIEVNVDEDQLEDRVDEAIQYFQEFHSDATYRAYVSQFAGDIAYYEQIQQYLSLLDMTLNGHSMVDFARKQNRIYIFGHVEDLDIKAGDYIVYEYYSTIAADSFTAIYNDMWLKEYTAALIKQQWGMNLIKFEGMQLPGGVIINGRQLYDDATGEIQDLRERIRLEHEMPADFFIG
jgi:hypothetical protein